MNVVTPKPLVTDYNQSTALPRLFDNGIIGGQLGSLTEAGEGPDESVYDAAVREMIEDAISFEESILAPDRDDNLRYFYGEFPEQEDGKSSAVSTDFRDTVMA